MKTKALFICISILIFSFSCKKEEAVSPDFACDKTTKITKQSFGDIAMIVEYANGKISKVYRADGKGLTENYSYKSATELTITRNFADGGVSNVYNATLNDKGYFLQFVQADKSFGYSIINTYDAAGFLLTSASSFISDPKLNSNSTYAYTNGNLTQVKNFTGNTLNYTTDYTYYEDKANKANLIGNENRPDMNGKFSKNLIKTMKYTYPDKKTDSYEYTYELNSNGFVKSLTEKYTDKDAKITNQVNKYEYTCL